MTTSKADVKGRWSKILNIAIPVVAIAMGLYHLTSTQYILQTPIEHQDTHYGFALVLVFLLGLRTIKKKLLPLQLGLIVLALVGTGYVKYFYEALEFRKGMPTTWDMVIGVILVVLALEATRQAYGRVVPVLACIFIGYAFTSQFFPGVLYHMATPFPTIISNLCMGFTGMFGTMLGVSANYIFLFMLFGGVMAATGAIAFFLEIGKVVGRLTRGGAAQTAVFSSALVGSVTGNAIANIAVTGTFTIPLMKKTGYTAEQAGAIESSASSIGQIMPPVMGASVFMMAGITGRPYIELMVAAILPALCYFLAVAAYAEFQARRLNITPIKGEKIDVKLLVSGAPSFIIPLTVIVVLFTKAYTPMYCAFWGIISILITGIITQLILKKRLGLEDLRKWGEAFVNGAISGAKIAAVIACVGLVFGVLVGTGLGVKLSSVIRLWSGGNLFLALFIAMFTSIILGMGVPTLVAYLLVAMIAVPVLLDMGVPMLAAHFFCLYFAVFSGNTPPVALSALAASQLAGGKYFKTAFLAWRILIAAFIVPFMIVWNPTLLLEPPSPLLGAATLVAVAIAIIAFAAVITAQYVRRLNVVEIVLFAVCALVGIVYTFTLDLVWLIGGVALFILLNFWQLRRPRKGKLVPLQ